MTASLPLRLAVLIAAIQQIMAPAIVFPRGFGGFSAETSVPSPVEPAGYAFAIWGVIYTGCLVYAVIQALPRYAQSEAFAAIRWPTMLLFLGSTLWLVLARYGPNWLTVPVIWGMLIAALVAMLRLARWRTPLASTVKLLVGWPLAIYAGWLSVAAFVNAATVLPWWISGLRAIGAEPVAQAGLIGAATLAIVVLVRSHAALAYGLTVVWALVAVVLANGGRGGALDNSAADSLEVMWIATGAAVLVVATLLTVRRLRPALRRG